jgi:NTE family protein
MRPAEPVTGLILSGGGARAAYQVGVLAAIAELLPPGAPNPFAVIVGTSAGAINAVSLASGATDFTAAVERLTAFWQGFRSHLVLRSDWPGVIRQASRFFIHSLLGLGRQLPVALLDSSPLRELLQDKLHLAGIDEAIRLKHLQAVAVTAFGYESGQAVTFYQGGGTIDPWLRHRRIGVPTQLTVEHLLASSAIPLLFAPVKLDQEFFGDGAVRQSARPCTWARVVCWWWASAVTHAAMNRRHRAPTPARSRHSRKSVGTCSTAHLSTAWKAISNCWNA